MPPLLKALRQNNLLAVQAAILEDAEAARYPFWDHSMEPPLCAAARLSCSPSIVEELLAHGAEPDAADVHGRTPLMLLGYGNLRSFVGNEGAARDMLVAAGAPMPAETRRGLAPELLTWV